MPNALNKEQIYHLERKLDDTLENVELLVDKLKRITRALRAKLTEAEIRIDELEHPTPEPESPD